MKDLFDTRRIALRTGLVLAALAGGSPAAAGVGTAVPEPTDLALFAMGVTGLILGHYGARRRPPRD